MSEFDFDWTGADPAFKVDNEIQEVGSVGATEYNIIIPELAPFFYDSLTVEYFNAGSWIPLVKDIDFTPGHLFVQATRQTTQAIYGSYVITNKNLTGAIRHSYQYLGGVWSVNLDQITEVLSNKVVNPRRTTWEQVTGIPEQFPSIPHVHIDEEDMTNMNDVNVTLGRLADTVEAFLIEFGAGGVGGGAPAVDPYMFTQQLPIAVGGETSSVVVDTSVEFTWRTNFTLSNVAADVREAQVDGDIIVIDVLVNGSSILSELLTIDNGDKDSAQAGIQPAIELPELNDGDVVKVIVVQAGDGSAVGLKVTLVGVPRV